MISHVISERSAMGSVQGIHREPHRHWDIDLCSVWFPKAWEEMSSQVDSKEDVCSLALNQVKLDSDPGCKILES